MKKPKVNIDRDNRIKRMHSNRKLAFVLDGFNFFIESEDIDFYTAVCFRPYTRENWQKALELKRKHEREFIQREYDCTGSTCVCVRVSRHKYSKIYDMHNVIVIKYHCSADV